MSHSQFNNGGREQYDQKWGIHTFKGAFFVIYSGEKANGTEENGDQILADLWPN